MTKLLFCFAVVLALVLHAHAVDVHSNRRRSALLRNDPKPAAPKPEKPAAPKPDKPAAPTNGSANGSAEDNDNEKQPENKEAPDFSKAFAAFSAAPKILGSSAAEIATDPVRKTFVSIKSAAQAVRAVIRLSKQDFMDLKKKEQSRAPVAGEAFVEPLIKKLKNATDSAKPAAPALLEIAGKPKKKKAGAADPADPPANPAAAPAPAAPAPAPAEEAPKITCSWSETQLKSPDTRQRVPAADLQQEGKYVWFATEKGPGAWSLAQNQRRCEKKLFSRSQYCRCKRTTKDVTSERASMDLNVQVTCVEDNKGVRRFIPPPSTCRTILRVQISYFGRAWINTDGGSCFPFSPAIEGIAVNEVMAKINDQDAFVKAGTVATGSKVESTITYQFAVKGGMSTTTASGEASVTIGYSEKITKAYGEKSVDVVGFATKDISASNNHALSAHLETVSHVSITGEAYSWASGASQTLGAGIWYAGISDCPGITDPALGWLVIGTAEQEAALTRQAEQFTQVYRALPAQPGPAQPAPAQPAPAQPAPANPAPANGP